MADGAQKEQRPQSSNKPGVNGSNGNRNRQQQQQQQHGKSAKTSLREVRILMLHGYTQSGLNFRAKTRALGKLLAKALAPAGLRPSLIYPTGPHRLSARDIPGFDEELGGGEEEEPADTWAWYRKEEATGRYVGLEQGMMRIAETIAEATLVAAAAAAAAGEGTGELGGIKEEGGGNGSGGDGDGGRGGKLDGGEDDAAVIDGVIDGVIGFSQGGSVAAMLAAAMEGTVREAPPDSSTTPTEPAPPPSSPSSPSSSSSSALVPDSRPTEEVGTSPPSPARPLPQRHPPAADLAWVRAVRSANRGRALRFAVVYSGFAAPDAAGLGWLYTPAVATPTLHVIGGLDTVVDEARSRGLAERCVSPLVVTHPGGHYVPVAREWVAPLAGFVRACVVGGAEGGKAM